MYTLAYIKVVKTFKHYQKGFVLFKKVALLHWSEVRTGVAGRFQGFLRLAREGNLVSELHGNKKHEQMCSRRGNSLLGDHTAGAHV